MERQRYLSHESTPEAFSFDVWLAQRWNEKFPRLDLNNK